MMLKRMVSESYVVCDHCNEEILDYSYTTKNYTNKKQKHFHDMKAGGFKGTVKKTCLELFEEKENTLKS